MRKVALIDRDGTLIKEPADFQIDSIQKFELVPGTISSLKSLKNLGFELIMVTNQDDLGSEHYPYSAYEEIQNLLMGILRSEGIVFDSIYLCPHGEGDNCTCRKPLLGMLPFELIRDIDRNTSVVIGDRTSDLEMAKNLGVRGLQINGDWEPVLTELLNRDIVIERVTKETKINLTLSEYSKKINIRTPIGFLNHMLETFTRYSNLGIVLDASGDTHVDNHHLIEDVAIVLGKALARLRELNPNRRRFSNIMVMDEAKCQMTLDFGGRIYLGENFNFSNPYIGEFPATMVKHFFKSLCDHAKMSLHIDLSGEDDHHQTEVLFKNLGMVISEATDPRNLIDQELLSTKGAL